MIKNAIIESTMLGREDYDILTFFINIRFDGRSHCSSVGGYCLDEYDPANETRVYSAKSMEIISKILEVVGVNTWEELPGKYIRFEDNGWGHSIVKIGNIMEDKWLDVEKFFSRGEK